MKRALRNAGLAAAGLFLACAASAAELEWQLQIELSVEGQQDWHNGQQSSKGSTSQQYSIETRLRSDGKLQGANLLDLNFDQRLAIKQEYMRRKGLEEAKQAGGGQLRIPRTDAERQQVSQQAQLDMYNCRGDPDCMSAVVQRYSAVFATAPSADGEPAGSAAGAALLDRAGRYLFFFGYDGCPNRMKAALETRVEGQIAFDRAGRKLVPFTLERRGQSSGDTADRKSLCRRYTAVVDTQDHRLYLDNVYLPSAHGISLRTLHGSPQQREEDLAPLGEALEWASQILRQADESGSATGELSLKAPLDGNATVGGLFSGSGKVTMKWSFLPIPPS
ncbi:hypothetical protein [Nevskia soli]|uniref:hypothetical protein n=1 Tax=Nevskia soli TaxID=418856 RepID=UPI0004A7121C|nr:hypothetical protein [Nevskia soli]